MGMAAQQIVPSIHSREGHRCHNQYLNQCGAAAATLATILATTLATAVAATEAATVEPSRHSTGLLLGLWAMLSANCSGEVKTQSGRNVPRSV